MGYGKAGTGCVTRKLARIELIDTRTEIRRRVASRRVIALGPARKAGKGWVWGREEAEDEDRSAVSSRTKGAHVFLYDREKKNKNTKGGLYFDRN